LQHREVGAGREQLHVGALGERVALGDVDAGREVDGQGDDDAPRTARAVLVAQSPSRRGAPG
jgi:hypothetical protein